MNSFRLGNICGYFIDECRSRYLAIAIYVIGCFNNCAGGEYLIFQVWEKEKYMVGGLSVLDETIQPAVKRMRDRKGFKQDRDKFSRYFVHSLNGSIQDFLIV